MTRIFISHSSVDARKADILTGELSLQGLSVARPEEFTSASDWQAEVLSAIRRCSLFIAIFSEEPAPSVMLELGYALGAAKPVLLLSSSETRIPFDVAALPVARFDVSDRASVSAAIERIRKRASSHIPPEQDAVEVQPRLERMVRDPEYLDQVSPREFESSVCAFLQQIGFVAEQMPPTHGCGYDILAKDPKGSVVAVVQVKKQQRSGMLGLADVRMLLGAMTVANAPSAILVTSSRFSPSARELAKRAPRPVLLLTLDDLVNSTRESITRACS